MMSFSCKQPKVCRVKGHNVIIARAAAKPGDEASPVICHFKNRCNESLESLLMESSTQHTTENDTFTP